jgi:hypothetical protein
MGFAIVLRRDDGGPRTCEVMRYGDGWIAEAGRHGRRAAQRALDKAVRHPMLVVALLVLLALRASYVVHRRRHRDLRGCGKALQRYIQQQQQGDKAAVETLREHASIVAMDLLSNHELGQEIAINAFSR